MTEKRFTLFEDLDIKDKATGKIYPPCLDKGLSALVDLLNQLNEENEQLKQRINVLDDQITAQAIVIESYQNRNQKLFDEKEHIKHTIKTMIETERTELGQSVLKQLWEQIE